eukprot:11250419-Alexandrium_andersonii.AAC.1
MEKCLRVMVMVGESYARNETPVGEIYNLRDRLLKVHGKKKEAKQTLMKRPASATSVLKKPSKKAAKCEEVQPSEDLLQDGEGEEEEGKIESSEDR